jgi:hypothetical protein|tara:strand:- start:252 stop:506 length:255 start_codon:yes stop_codon:yes gene_type:complete
MRSALAADTKKNRAAIEGNRKREVGDRLIAAQPALNSDINGPINLSSTPTNLSLFTFPISMSPLSTPLKDTGKHKELLVSREGS